MRTVTMNKHVTLQRIAEAQQRYEDDTVCAQTVVFASVRVPSLTFRSGMMSAGLETALTVTLWRSEFEKAAYTHVVVDNVPYRIASVGVGLNDLFVNIALERI